MLVISRMIKFSFLRRVENLLLHDSVLKLHIYAEESTLSPLSD
jgi:hypothetical protein